MINIQPMEKRQVSDGSSLSIHSIFYTIQGEGPFTGCPAVFVRLAGCNLQCPSCDTDYTSIRSQLSVNDIVKLVKGKMPKRLISPLVVVTGGEPFRQNIVPFLQALKDANFGVQIETNGTLPPESSKLPDGVYVVCSPKAGKVHPGLHQHISAYKYVLSHDSIDMDGLPIRALNHTAAPRVARPHAGFNGPVYLQPMDPKNDEDYKRNVRAVKRSCMQNGYILQLQVHKLIEVE